MYIYVGVFGVLSLFSIFEYMNRDKKNYFRLSITMLALLAGFRYKTGYDYVSYNNFFDKLTHFRNIFDGSIDAEPGYLFLNYLIKNLGMNFSAFVLLFSITSIVLLGFCLSKSYPLPMLPLTYYYARFFLVRDMGQIRSSIVSIIFLWSLPYFKNRQTGKVIMISLLGSLFHSVSLFIIPAYLFYLIFGKVSMLKSLVILFLCIVVGVIFFFPNLYLFLIPERYQGYLSGYYAQGAWILNPVFLMQVLILFSAIIIIKQKTSLFKESFNLVLVMYLLSTLLLVCFGPLATIGGRIGTIFSTVEIFIVPIMLDHLIKNKLLYIILFLGFAVVIFILIFILSGAYNSYLPYDTLF